jgi:hypothetical protein
LFSHQTVFLPKTSLCSSSIELIHKSTQHKLCSPWTRPTSKSSMHPPQPPLKVNNDSRCRSCNSANMSTDTAPKKRFPKPTLTPITSKPNHQTLSALNQELNSNAISVNSAFHDMAELTATSFSLSRPPSIFPSLASLSPPWNTQSTVPTIETNQA